MPKQKIPAYLRQENKSHHHSKDELDEMIKIEKELRGENDLLDQAPETLSDLGKQYYYFIVNELVKRDILSNLDIPMVEQAADCLDKMQIADEMLNDQGMFIQGKDTRGNEFLKEHPAVGTKQKYLNQFRYCAGQLGMSPSSRAQLAQAKIEQKVEDDKPLSKIMERKKK